jgi:nucleotide-binding universal stress UspA family protein
MLVAVSSPWASQKLAAPLADLAHRLDAEVVVTHVAQLHDEDEHETDAQQRGEQTLQMLTDLLNEAGVRSEALMLFSDDVPKAIINTAKARGCTMIVLGLTGKGVLKRLIAGDVPANIIRQADLPVLLCPANWLGMI